MASATISTSTAVSKALTNLQGGLCRSVTWRIDDQANVAEILIPNKRIEEFRQYNAGRAVWVKAVRNYASKVIFHGWITGRYMEFSPEDESVSVVCMGPRWKMGGAYVKGRYMAKSSGGYDVFTGIPCIFNEKIDRAHIAPGNGATSKTSMGRPFSVDPFSSTNSTPFSVNDMLYYCWKVGKGEYGDDVVGSILSLSSHGVGSIGSDTPYDVNVDALNLTEAFDTIMKKGGLRWWCRPISTSKSELRAFVSGAAADTTKKYLKLNTAGTTVSASSNITNAGRIHEDFSENYNEVHGYGDRKRFEDDLVFVPGWDTDVETTLLAQEIETIRQEIKQSTSTSWDTYKDIGRLWILREFDDESGEEVYDLSSVFGHSNYAERRRVLEASLISQDTPPDLIVSNTSLTDTSVKAELTVRLLEDQAGFYLEGNLEPPVFVEKSDLNSSPIFAATITMKAVIQEDNAIYIAASNPATQSGYMVGIISGGNDKVERKLPVVVEEYSTDNTDVMKEVDVLAAHNAYVLAKGEENKNPRVSGSFSIPWIALGYEPGDIIGGIKGRDIFFLAQIIEVVFNFIEQTTEIVVEDYRLAEA